MESNARKLDQKIYQLMSQAFIRLDMADQQLMKRYGLTMTQSWALVHIEDVEGRSLSELARLLMCDKSNVTSIVDKLEDEGLAVRNRGKAGDRRYTRVVLTEQGQRLRQSIIAAREHLVRERFLPLNDQDRQQLYEALVSLTQLLNRQYSSEEETRIIDEAFAEHQLPSTATSEA
jgi:DNA-binding MarR family transcriptional regulator